MSQTTPNPYVPGRSLDLLVTRAFDSDLDCQHLVVNTEKAFRVTQSPVMVVTLNTSTGPLRVVLKLYDRRFGPDFRTGNGKYVPHTSQDEGIWQEYVDQGRVPSFYDRIDQEEAESSFPWSPRHYYDDSWEGHAEYEGALQRRALEYFDREAAAYDRLFDLQGTCIPKMLAHVCLPQVHSAPTTNEHYFRVPGVLMQFIGGCSLWQLADRPNGPRSEELEDIVQAAIDIATVINERGVVMEDCRPENVIVEWDTHRPFIHDFSQGFFKEECDDSSERGFHDAVFSRGNPRAIGMVMTTRAKKSLRYNLNIHYPEWNGIPLATFREFD